MVAKVTRAGKGDWEGLCTWALLTSEPPIGRAGVGPRLFLPVSTSSGRKMTEHC